MRDAGPSPHRRAGSARRSGAAARAGSGRSPRPNWHAAEAHRRRGPPGRRARPGGRRRIRPARLAMPRARFAVDIGPGRGRRRRHLVARRQPRRTAAAVGQGGFGGRAGAGHARGPLGAHGPAPARCRERPAATVRWWRRPLDRGPSYAGVRRDRRRASAARRPWRSAGPWRPSAGSTRCWWSPTCPRSPPSPITIWSCASSHRGSGPSPPLQIVEGSARVVELSRMLSGRPDSADGPTPRRGAARPTASPSERPAFQLPTIPGERPGRGRVRWPTGGSTESRTGIDSSGGASWRSTSSSPVA